MGTSASSLASGSGKARPLTIVSPVSDWTVDRTDDEIRNDQMDSFNHPRLRRLLILQSLLSERRSNWTVEHVSTECAEDGLDVYKAVHSDGLLNFLDCAWSAWEGMGEEGRDPSGWSPEFKGDPSETVPPLVPTVVPFHRATNRQRPSSHVIGQVGYYCTDAVTPIFADLKTELHKDAGVIKRVLDLLLPPSLSPFSAVTKESTGSSVPVTPIEPPSLADALEPTDTESDEENNKAGEVEGAAPDTSSPTEEEAAPSASPAPPASALPVTSLLDDHHPPVIYALTTHPGHHAAYDSYGGYCYVNNVAALARHLQHRIRQQPVSGDDPINTISSGRVAILDVDYHCGNGTASIFDDDPNVLVVSLHCHPDYDYPFHSGYGDETGTGPAKGTTLHLPMMPGMEWPNYKVILERGLAKIRNFGPSVCLISLGLDTHENDPCAVRRAGFKLKTDDYLPMGRTIARNLPGIPLVVVQEGGYRMDKVGEAAANAVLGCCTPGPPTADVSRPASMLDPAA